MHATQALLAFAMASGALAAPLRVRDETSCRAAADSCRVQPGANQSYCSSELASCLGYNPYTQVATPTAAPTTVVSASASSASASASANQCQAAADICRAQSGANQATCSAEFAACLGYNPYTTTVTSSAAPVVTSSAPASASASASSSKEQCQAAANTCRVQPGSNQSYCSSEFAKCLGYNPYTEVRTQYAAPTSAPSAASIAASAAVVATEAGESVIPGAQWTLKDLVRTCSDDGASCNYTFTISTADGRADDKCTVNRTPGASATTETFYDAPCNAGSANKISWGYSDQFGADDAFAVLTVVNEQQGNKAYFGISDINSRPGNYGTIGPLPVYSF